MTSDARSKYETADRDIRQRDIISPDILKMEAATIVGVGAIGRQVALQLAAVGVDRLQLIDFDVVSVENLAVQGFSPADIGKNKVDAVGCDCIVINPGVEITKVVGKYKSNIQVNGVVFSCVDSMDGRKIIWDKAGSKARFWCDGRMAAEAFRVLVAYDDESRAFYPTTLFSQAEMYVGACTAKSTIYCANAAAAFMVAQYVKFLRGMPLDHDINVNLLSMEVSTS